MVQIKSLFHGWKTVTKERARRYAIMLFENITAMSEKEKIKYINENRLKGISFEELIN